MRALWVEDHVLIGDSLEMLLQVVMPELSLDKAHDVRNALALVRAIPYDLVLLDWWLGPDTGEHAMVQLRAGGCVAPFLIVSGDEREVVKRRALALGAVGFVLKASPPQTLVETIRAALAREPGHAGAFASPEPTPAPARPSVRLGSLFPELTERQVDVFEQLTLGRSDKQIARHLGVANSTVRTHVRAILEIIGVHSRGEATHEAQLRGAGAL